MINYTEHLTLLMRDIVKRVEALSFIDMSDVLVFSRFGRSGSAGPIATCHCLNLPDTEPGYYFWRDRTTGQMTRRSEWFVTRSPVVIVDGRTIEYLLSFTLPRFCDQSLDHSRKSRLYGETTARWVAKLDTVVHELYHIDPDRNGIRRLARRDGTCAANSHGPQFFADVARLVSEYLDSRPDPALLDFLTHDFDVLAARHDGVGGACFRRFPSYPQRFQERLAEQPVIDDAEFARVLVEAWRRPPKQALYTDAHVYVREFLPHRSRRLTGRRRDRAA